MQFRYERNDSYVTWYDAIYFVAKDFHIKYRKYCDRIYKILVVLKTEIQDTSGEILNS